jgi:hypothetical protein
MGKQEASFLVQAKLTAFSVTQSEVDRTNDPRNHTN